MRQALPAVFVIMLATATVKGSSFPEEEFAFAPDSAPTTVAGDEQIRQRILQALTKPSRDELLEKLVPSRLISGEKWFDLRGIVIHSGDLSGRANLSRICWDYAHFQDIDLSEANWEETLLRGATFRDVTLTRVQLDRSHLESADFVDCNLEEASFKNVVFDRQSRFRRCNANGAHFENSMGRIQCDSASLRGAIFRHCVLANALFNEADLTGADFREATLPWLILRRSIIDGIDLTDTELRHVRLDQAVLSSPLRLVRTKLFAPCFGDLDFSKVDISYVEWEMHDFRLGEELAADSQSMAAKDRIGFYSQAEVVYRTLGDKYRQSGHVEEYLRIRFRVFETRRKLLLLDRDGRWSAECLWLNTSRFLDHYGTDFFVLLKRFLSMIGFFSIVYYVGWVSLGQKWFRWYRTQPEGMGLLIDQSAEYIEIPDQSTHCIATTRGLWKGCCARVRFLLMSIGISLEASFMFAERFLNVPNILHLFRIREERPIPQGVAKWLFGIQAVCGLIFVFLVGRIILLLVAG